VELSKFNSVISHRLKKELNGIREVSSRGNSFYITFRASEDLRDFKTIRISDHHSKAERTVDFNFVYKEALWVDEEVEKIIEIVKGNKQHGAV
jgi:light-regulated signal transduction histidine kinase (bacteriophytochrome)